MSIFDAYYFDANDMLVPIEGTKTDREYRTAIAAINNTEEHDMSNPLVNKVIRTAIAQDVTSEEIEQRDIKRVPIAQVESGDIELTSRTNPRHNLVVDYIEDYGEDSVLVFYVGHASPREVAKNYMTTVAR